MQNRLDTWCPELKDIKASPKKQPRKKPVKKPVNTEPAPQETTPYVTQLKQQQRPVSTKPAYVAKPGEIIL
ncbi:MAG: hypothetical protein ACRCR2_02630 [Fusobacteriaceae bacterium]